MANQVEVVEEGALVRTGDAAALLEKFFADTTAVEPEDPRQVQMRIMADLLASKTREELFAPRTLPAWRDLIGVPMQVRGVRWNASDLDPDSPVYAVVDVVNRQTGEPLLLSCGAKSVMVQLYTADQQGWLPADLVLVASKANRAGRTSLHLEIG